MTGRDASGDGLRIDLTIDSAEERDELPSLKRWLEEDLDTASRPAIREDSERGKPTGRMGGAVEVISIVLTDATAVVGALTSVLTWRSARARPPEISVRIAGGPSVRLTEASVEEIRGSADPDGDGPALGTRP